MKKKLLAILLVCAMLISPVSVHADSDAEKTNTEKQTVSGSQMKIHAIYLGEEDYGDSVLLESEGEYLLMDMGTKNSYPTIKKYLDKQGVKKLSLYYSHWHGDHTGGMGETEGYASLLGDFDVENIYVPDAGVYGKVDMSWYYAKLKQRFEQQCPDKVFEDNVHYLKPGIAFKVGDAVVNVIGPVDIDKLTEDNVEDNDSDYINNCSLVAQVVCGQTKYLTCGDCSEEEESLLVDKYGEQLKSDIYKMSHHGYTSANKEKLLDIVQPDFTFALNSGNAAKTKENSAGRAYRATYTSLKNCSEYGICYLVGNEQKNLVIDVKNDDIRLYPNGSTTPLEKWVKLYGSDGVYELYDYYYLNADGKPVTGITKIGDSYYNFGTGGCMHKGYYKKVDTQYEYIPWVNEEGKNGQTGFRYYDRYSGEMSIGWSKIGQDTYYFDFENGFRTNGLKKIDGKYYYFKNTGQLYNKDTWVSDSKGNRSYVKSNGEALTGFVKVRKKLYYIDPDTAWLVKNKSVKAGNIKVKTDKNGVVTALNISSTTPSKLTAGKGKFVVRWKRDKNVSGYEIYVSKKKTSGYKLAKVIKKNSITSAKINKKKGTYYVKIRKYKTISGVKLYSKYGSAKKIRVKK